MCPGKSQMLCSFMGIIVLQRRRLRTAKRASLYHLKCFEQGRAGNDLRSLKSCARDRPRETQCDFALEWKDRRTPGEDILNIIVYEFPHSC